MQARGVIRVGMTEFNSDEIVPFKIDHVSAELLGHHQFLGNLTRESGPPRGETLWRRIPLHHFDGVRRRHDSGVWKSLEDGTNPEPMIAVTMCDVDGRQILVLGRDPICQGGGLLDGHERIHEDGVTRAVDERGRHRLEKRLVYSFRPLRLSDRYARRHKHFPFRGSDCELVDSSLTTLLIGPNARKLAYRAQGRICRESGLRIRRTPAGKQSDRASGGLSARRRFSDHELRGRGGIRCCQHLRRETVLRGSNDLGAGRPRAQFRRRCDRNSATIRIVRHLAGRRPNGDRTLEPTGPHLPPPRSHEIASGRVNLHRGIRSGGSRNPGWPPSHHTLALHTRVAGPISERARGGGPHFHARWSSLDIGRDDGGHRPRACVG